MNTLLLIGGIGMQEILIIALIVLLLFGGKKIPELDERHRHERHQGCAVSKTV